MIQSIKIIAINTYKELIRDRILLSLLVFSVLLLGSSLFLGSISLDQDNRIIIDFGLTGIFIFGVIITLFASGSSLNKELDHRTAYTTLARPLKRSWFIIGKFAGLCLTMLTLTILMSIAFLLLLVIKSGWHMIDASLLLAIFYIYLELCLLTALALMFASFSSTIMGMIYSLAIFLIGHSSTSIVALIQSSSSWTRYIFLIIYYFLPNLNKFNLRNDAVYHLAPQPNEVMLTILYAVIYIIILLYVAIKAFDKQEL